MNEYEIADCGGAILTREDRMPGGTNHTTLLLQNHHLHALLRPHGEVGARRRLPRHRLCQRHRLLRHEGPLLRHGPHLLPSLRRPPLAGPHPNLPQNRRPPPPLHHPHGGALAQRRDRLPPPRPGPCHQQDRQELPRMLPPRTPHPRQPRTAPNVSENSRSELPKHPGRHVRVDAAFAGDLFLGHVFESEGEGDRGGVGDLLGEYEFRVVDLSLLLQGRHQAVERGVGRLALHRMAAVARPCAAERFSGVLGVVVVRDHSVSERFASKPRILRGGDGDLDSDDGDCLCYAVFFKP